MGLTKWWLARSEEASAKASLAEGKKRSKWALLFGGLRHHSANRLRCGSKPGAATSPCGSVSVASVSVSSSTSSSSSSSSSSERVPSRSDRVSASVSQAKRFVQQQCAAVSLCPSLVQLGVPKSVLKKEPIAVAVPVVANAPLCGVRVEIVSEAVRAFEQRAVDADKRGELQLEMTSEGCGGAYFVRTSNAEDAEVMGIFKPRDEEYMAPKNPRGYVKEGAIVGETEHPVNKGFLVGNGALRERAAYLLDEAYGNFSGVPVTSVVKLHVHGEEKEGSIQAFVPSECSAEDMGSLKFSVPEVHKIGILDVRLFNTDRHAGNILLHARGPHVETYAMTPIDHGFSLPSYKHLDGAFMDWLSWPQSEYPFTCEELDHIASLDATQDAAILRSVGIEEECITTMRICTALLQLGADAGFSLHEIGGYLQREGDFSQPSSLETLVAEASMIVSRDIQETEDPIAFMNGLVEQAVKVIERTLKNQPKKKVRSISCFS